MADVRPQPQSTAYTLLLLGKTGNGKSATGNSILGRDAFEAKRSAKAVTAFCDSQTAELLDGRTPCTIQVVDTPGFYEASQDPKEIRKVIVECVDHVKDGIHALLLVLSAASRLTKEEMKVVETLKSMFGTEVMKYMIVVFTRGDDFLKEDESTPESMPDANELRRRLVEYLKEGGDLMNNLVKQCGSRIALFNNKSGDKNKQRALLLEIVDRMVLNNGGKPYTNELFREAQRVAKEVEEKKLRQEQELEAKRGQFTEADFQRMKAEIMEGARNDQFLLLIKSWEQNIEAIRREAQQNMEGVRRENDELRRQVLERGQRVNPLMLHVKEPPCSIM